MYLFVPMCLYAQITKVYTISFSEKDFSFTKNSDFLNIVSKDDKAIIWGDSLDPALPWIGVNILIDYTDDYAGFSYNGNEKLVESDVSIYHNPVILPTNIHQETIHSHQIEYANKSYPDENVQFTGAHMMDGYKFLSFVICPFRYDADNKNLYLKKEINLHLNLKSLSSKHSPMSPGENMRDIVRDLTINGSEMDTLYPHSTRTFLETDTISYKYIIVTNEALKPSFEKLAHWKTIKGVRSKVITVEDCYDAHPNLTPQLAIKTVLANYYKNNDMKYALLAGDTDIVPSQICYLPHRTEDTTDTPADLYYACIDTINCCFSWDANGNNVYGELNDNVDLAPEFIITRCSVSTLAEAEILVNRIIEYESSPKTDGWTKKMLSCGNIAHYYVHKNGMLISDSQDQGEYVYENGVQPFWDGSFFELFDTYSSYPDSANYDATGDHFQIEFEKGYTFIDEFSHGWANKWGWLEDSTLYKLDKASSLVNSGYSIITTTACYTNAFDKISTDFPKETEYYTTCLSESIMRNADSGILAYFGSSREGWNYISHFFSEKFYENLLSSDDKQFGSAAMSAKIDFITASFPPNFSPNYYNSYRWLIMSINPLGDPEMSVYTQIPQTFNNVSVSFSNGNLSVSAGISDCTICISSAADFGDSYYRMYINANGVSLSDVNADCYLCITKQGYIPYIVRVGNSVFLQNEDIVRNLSVFSTNTYVGSNVNSSMTQGPVTIHKGKVVNKSTGSITIQNDFEVKSGAEFEILLP